MTWTSYPACDPHQPLIPAPSRPHPLLRVAVIIPCHNYGRFLAECLDSVLAQSHPAAEIVVVLDDCTDDSVEVARRYRSRGVHSLTVRCCDPMLSRRAGLRLTTAPVVCFLDADDWISPEFLGQGLTQFCDPNVGIVTPVVEEFGCSQGTWSPDLCDLRQDNCCSSASLVRRIAIEGSRAFEQLEPIGMRSEDHWLWSRLASSGWQVAHSPGIHHYRRHDRNETLHYPQAWADRYRNDVGPVTVRKVRVGVVMDCHLVGGVARHLDMLLKHCRVVDWQGLVVVDAGPTDAQSVAATLPTMPVYGGIPHPRADMNAEGVTRRATAAVALAEMAERCDVLYVWGFHLRPLLQPYRHRIPIVASLHATGSWAAAAAAEVADLADELVGVAERCRMCLPPDHRRRMRVIPNGVDLGALHPLETRWSVRQRWGVSSRQIAVGYVGRWSHEKNPLAIARAVRALGSKAVAVYCCPQVKEPGSALTPAVRRDVEQLTGGRVVWTRSDTMGEIYQALDCLVLPSHEEGGPLVALEAFATGCPLVATPVGSLPDLQVQHRGIYVPVPQDPSAEAVAAAVLQAVNPANRPMVARAREFALYHAGARRMARNWALEFATLTENRSAYLWKTLELT